MKEFEPSLQPRSRRSQRRWRLSSAAHYLWSFKLTPGGRVLVGAILLTALGSVTTQLPIYLLFAALLALLGVSELTGLAFKPVLSVEGQAPVQASAGQPVTTHVTLTNRSRRRPALDVMLCLFGLPRGIKHLNADASLVCLRPGATAALPVTLRADQRGIYPLPPLRAVSTFPFNLVRVGGGRTPPGRLVVLPAFHSLEELDIPVSHRYQPRGITLTRGVGHSLEFVGNREYVPGEPARRIDAKAWGRIGKPVVKEFHDEYVCRIALILDTYVPSRWLCRPHDRRRLEAAVSLMAAISEQLNFHEHVIDLFAAGPELYVFRTLGGTTHFENVLEILAGVDACHRHPFEQISPLVIEELETISTAVCVFIDWDPLRREFCRRVQEAGCVLKGVLVRDDPTEIGEPPPVDQEGGWTVVTTADIEQGRLLRL
jgi:uncharacterized protein (DUF58 family)